MKKNIFLKFSLILILTGLVLIPFDSLFYHCQNEKISAQNNDPADWDDPEDFDEYTIEDILQELEEKCVIDAVIENGFEIGKIPIGETVDYAELYAQEIIRNLNIMITNTEKAANTAYNENSEDDLYDLFSSYENKIVCQNCETAPCDCEYDEEGECTHCSCECMDCKCKADSTGCRCQNANCGCSEPNKGKSTSCGCACKCACDRTSCIIGSCSCLVNCSGCQENSEEFCVCDYECSGTCKKPLCELLCKVTSGVNIIQNAYKKITITNDNITNLVDVEGKITLCDCPETNLGFVGGEIEIPEQLNRWKIVYAFTDSRNKLEECIRGYEHIPKIEMTKMILLNCMTALDNIETEEGMGILPGFEYFADPDTIEYLCFQDLAPIDSDYCYPYNSEAFLTDKEKEICRKNRDSVKCEKIILEKNLMYNFFCCKGVIK